MGLKLIIGLLSAVLLGACSSSGDRSDAPLSFVPGQVISSIPVYPGATPSFELVAGFGPPSFPLDAPICAGPRCPGLQMASYQFTVQASDIQIMDWYTQELSKRGYRTSGGGAFGIEASGRHLSGVSFFLPEQPLVNVEVHIYSRENNPTLVDILVTYLSPLLNPTEELIPGDIERIEVTKYASTGVQPNSQTQTVKDAAAIDRLAKIVNNMPVYPDWSQGCDPGAPRADLLVAQLRFITKRGNAIVMRRIIHSPCPRAEWEFDSITQLEDVHNLLSEAINTVFGIQLPTPDPARPIPPTPRQSTPRQ